MTKIFFITHPEVVVDPQTPVERWSLSEKGIARARAFARTPDLKDLSTIWSSEEAKALETARILAAANALPINTLKSLGENDRSATGFLPPEEFEEMADRFFAHPDDAIRGWESARNAQQRVREAFDTILETPASDDIAIVAHGAVGTLLYCDLTGNPIKREFDQPFQGNYWTFDRETGAILHPWKSIAPRELTL